VEAAHGVDVPMAVQHREPVLEGKGRNPRVGGRNRITGLSQGDAQPGVHDSRLVGDGEDVEA
jgi:hypothetical protein